MKKDNIYVIGSLFELLATISFIPMLVTFIVFAGSIFALLYNGDSKFFIQMTVIFVLALIIHFGSIKMSKHLARKL